MDTKPQTSSGNRSYLIHYDEIGLKGGNRAFFEEQLLRNIQTSLRGLGVSSVRRLFGRLRLDQRADGNAEELEKRLARVYGIAHFDPVRVMGWDLDRVREVLVGWAHEGGFRSFAMRARRVNKEFPHTSQELNRELGALVKEESGAQVNLDAPERTFHLLVLNQEIFLYHRRLPGPGGLPIGVGGRVALLLSGGIDSQVAGERLLRRGCTLEFIHFHSAPYTDRASQEKAVELAEILCRHRFTTRLHLVPLGKLQQKIVTDAPEALRVLLYRRYMLRLAERIAYRSHCRVLATGESLGQVASQTLANLALLDVTVEMPILRPLITRDKREIVDEARAIGTFDLSTEPASDCCSYLMPHHPVTQARGSEVKAIEAELQVEELLEEILEESEEVPIEESR